MGDPLFKASIQEASDFSIVPVAKVLVCTHKLDGSYVKVSQSARTLLGYDPEELMGHSAYEFIHPDDAAIISNEHHRNALLQGTADSVIYRLRCKGGQYRVMETVTHSVRNSFDLPIELITRTIALN